MPPMRNATLRSNCSSTPAPEGAVIHCGGEDAVRPRRQLARGRHGLAQLARRAEPVPAAHGELRGRLLRAAEDVPVECPLRYAPMSG